MHVRVAVGRVLCSLARSLTRPSKKPTHSTAGAFARQAERKRINCDVENKNTRGAKIIRTERLEYKDISCMLAPLPWPLQLTASIFFTLPPRTLSLPIKRRAFSLSKRALTFIIYL